MLLCLAEPPGRFLFLLFINFCSSFCCYSSLIFVLHLLLLFFIHCFSTSSLILPWTITRFLHPFYTFCQAHHRVICNTFIFNLSRIFFHSFTASATVLSGDFFTHRHFLPCTPSPTFLPSWEPEVLP